MKTRTLACVLIAIAAQSAFALQVRCDYCSEAQFEAKALALSAGEHYVYDVPNGNVKKYSVSRESIGSSSTATHRPAAHLLPVEDNVQGLVSMLQKNYQLTGGAMAKRVLAKVSEIPKAPSGPGRVVGDPRGLTAYDAVNNAYTGTDVRVAARNWIATSAGQSSTFFNGLLESANANWLGTEMQVNLVVTFADGSTVQIDFTTHMPEGQITSAYDPKGVPVMTVGSAPQMYVGKMISYPSHQDLENWLRNAKLNGVRVVGESQSSNVMSCKWHSEVLTCQRN